jgi:hypothetical protein
MSGIVTFVVEPAGPWLLEEGLQHILDHFKVLDAAAQFLEEGTKIQWGLGAAHMNSPLTLEVQALNKPQLATRAVGEYARAAHAPRPPVWIRYCPPYRKVLTRKGIQSTQISCQGAETLEFSQNFTARALRNLDALYQMNLAHTAYGAREGYISNITTYHGKPSFSLVDVLNEQSITCVVKDKDVERRIGPSRSWDEAWKRETVSVEGMIFYDNDGSIKKIEVQDLLIIQKKDVSLEDIYVEDFTKGFSVSEYLEGIRDGRIS